MQQAKASDTAGKNAAQVGDRLASRGRGQRGSVTGCLQSRGRGQRGMRRCLLTNRRRQTRSTTTPHLNGPHLVRSVHVAWAVKGAAGVVPKHRHEVGEGLRRWVAAGSV